MYVFETRWPVVTTIYSSMQTAPVDLRSWMPPCWAAARGTDCRPGGHQRLGYVRSDAGCAVLRGESRNYLACARVHLELKIHLSMTKFRSPYFDVLRLHNYSNST